ncbi:hypothetical protein [Mesorhizobium sp.]|uniref:hypothetical protein n=1 Tax=Mesorhizobium sp. TaxID=1871066 RepID=UPI000FE6DF6F|nr:hypothetical protein [Mesorhizobium sp.]RWN11760.1 MAG: hypothetical protein EOR87_14670 [Mesorhizobium sp.]RWN19453.1 MAG: hypothetical protein EOR88_09895 [Mesorhizobium sp.]
MGLIDFDALLYGPVHAILGDAEAELTLACGDPPVTLTVIDKTEGIEVLDGPSVATIWPAAVVRAALLAEKGIAVESLPKASLRLNGKDWTVVQHSYAPSPQGEDKGEVRLLLESCHA